MQAASYSQVVYSRRNFSSNKTRNVFQCSRSKTVTSIKRSLDSGRILPGLGGSAAVPKVPLYRSSRANKIGVQRRRKCAIYAMGDEERNMSSSQFGNLMDHSKITFTALSRGSIAALHEMVEIGLRFYHAGYTVAGLSTQASLMSLEKAGNTGKKIKSEKDAVKFSGNQAQWVSMVIFPMITAYAAGVPCAKTGKPWDPTVGDPQSANLLQYVKSNFVEVKLSEERLRLQQMLAKSSPGEEGPKARPSPAFEYQQRTNRLVTNTLSHIYVPTPPPKPLLEDDEEDEKEESVEVGGDDVSKDDASEGEGLPVSEAKASVREFTLPPARQPSDHTELLMSFLAGMSCSWAARCFLEKAVGILIGPRGEPPSMPSEIIENLSPRDFDFQDQLVPVGADGTAPSQTYSFDLFKRWIRVIYLTLMELGMVESQTNDELEEEDSDGEMVSLLEFVQNTLKLASQQDYAEHFKVMDQQKKKEVVSALEKDLKASNKEQLVTPSQSQQPPREDADKSEDTVTGLRKENSELRAQVEALERQVQLLRDELEALRSGPEQQNTPGGMIKPDEIGTKWIKDPFVGEFSSAVAVMNQQTELVLMTQAVCSILNRPIFMRGAGE
mmetsp:Transcript_26635/g.32345  ORF Transcript_26635/g.32345 Transcript_26635/m.32345 type:complete len:611 (-) Transcript_26635:1065-2897(-)|eukprot:CAMPEP_0197847556 /NCGR_PEP_ID=MMETSP1438-20131217/6396_1 /TAXON_ID=1461541 /ORGANISM="Pterosperma sp., Strain CCMP1384" /LENGTH=610 /DNA_ID=CAMNT_0043459507 /DNA_START=98 /DNA_END=1930 /DNA_ORIENTATION=+